MVGIKTVDGCSDSIPVIDLSAFIDNGDVDSRKVTAKALNQALKIHGCIAVKGHGVPQQLLNDAFAMIKKLYDLPHGDKMKAPHPEGPFPHRGYSAPDREMTSEKALLEADSAEEKERIRGSSDCKETYEIGSDRNLIEQNIWLPEDVLPGFRPFMTKFFWKLNELAMRILEALIASLELTSEECDSVRAMHSGENYTVRLAHYLPITNRTEQDGKSYRIAPHKDWSSFTLLFQEQHGGLEFENRETGEWMFATPLEGVLYMNIGDVFDRVSNGIYPSSNHRVVSPTSPAGTGSTIPSRYSIPFFAPPDLEAIMEPQPSLVKAVGKARYESVSFAEYNKQMFEVTQKRDKD